MTSERTCNCIVYGGAIFILTSGIIIGFTWPFIFNNLLRNMLELNPNTNTYKLWLKTPIPMYFDVYLFNWTNSKEFLKDKSVKPQFEEIGPFVFKEVHERVNVKWNENETVTYYQKRTWNFIPEQSVNLSVKITNLNVIATIITQMASRYNSIIKEVLKYLTLFYKEELLITRSANEWLFSGMNDGLLDLIKKWTFVPIPYDKFGWFYGRNLSMTYDGVFNIKTGHKNISDLGMLDKWNDVNETKYFSGQCGLIEGTTGELFPPLTNFQNNLTIFITDFCGPLSLKYAGETKVDDIYGYKYIGDESVFDNGTKYSSNRCFCSGECQPSGIRNVTSCRRAPLFVSFPHFYLADPIYINSIEGMKPSKSEHEFYLKIDPLSGIPLEVRAQLQLNILLRPLKMFPMFAEVPKTYIPMLWFRQRAHVTQDLATQGKMLRILSTFGLGLTCALGLTALLLVLIRMCFVHFHSGSRRFEPLITSEIEKEDNQERGDESDER